MSEQVVLEYKRVEVTFSTGRILHKEDGAEEKLYEFTALQFPQMLELFAESLRRFPEAKAVWQRTDRPGLNPYELDLRIAKMFREDPEAAIASMCPPQQELSPSMAASRARPQVKTVGASVRAGFDTLADAFGDSVYSRARARTDGFLYVECPCCGIWTPIHAAGPSAKTLDNSHCMNTRCRVFDKPLALNSQGEKWVGYTTTTLLATASPRFYLPRAWNDGRSWITWEALNQKYNEYEKEKEAWASRTAPRGA